MIARLRNWFGRRKARAGTVAAGDPVRVAQVQEVLRELRPAFRADGGDLVLEEVREDGSVLLRARGACHGCGASVLTLQGALAPRLRERCAWFRRVELLES